VRTQPLALVAGVAALQRRLDERPQRQAVVRRDQVDRRPQVRDAHDLALLDEPREILGAEAVEPRPQAVVRRVRVLRLHRDEVAHRLDGASALAPEQELAGEQRAVEVPPRQRRSGRGGHPRIVP